ncbi:MAG: hypothetical protein EOP11_07965 [Proteobacteria bacterium]|nr:MAG: hypothetical protein EOP11_07965 [Pseudomonadota bacterium]
MISLLLTLFLSPLAPAKFDDAALKSRLEESAQKKTKLLIYTWSPQMPISVKGLTELMATAGERNFKVLALLDGGANLAAAKQVAKEKKLPASVLERDESLELRKLGSHVHFPAYILVNGGAFTGGLLPGYRSPAALKSLTEEKFR